MLFIKIREYYVLFFTFINLALIKIFDIACCVQSLHFLFSIFGCSTITVNITVSLRVSNGNRIIKKCIWRIWTQRAISDGYEWCHNQKIFLCSFFVHAALPHKIVFAALRQYKDSRIISIQFLCKELSHLSFASTLPAGRNQPRPCGDSKTARYFPSLFFTTASTTPKVGTK